MDSTKRTTILNEYNAGQRKLPSTAAAMHAYLVADMEIDIADAELDAMRTKVQTQERLEAERRAEEERRNQDRSKQAALQEQAAHNADVINTFAEKARQTALQSGKTVEEADVIFHSATQEITAVVEAATRP
jgi:uncharacterized protein involved in exopolysaccharide biosynthesis